MAQLVASTALTLVEVALKNTILLAVGQRIGPTGATSQFPDVATLKTYASATLRADELAFVTAKGFTYQFDRFSTATDDGDLVIAPNDAGVSGRWLRTASTIKTGYAKQVRVHAGEETYQAMLKRSLAARPSVHLIFDSVDSFSRSLSIGALYQMAARYKVRVIGSNLRSQAQSIEGSTVPSETDPGTHQMVGDIIAAVAGSALGQTGVVYSQIAVERYSESPEEGRLFVEELEVTVFYTVQQPDTDATTIDALSGLYVQRELLGGGSPYDASNLVKSGYTVPIGAGFLKTPAPGTAVIGGAAVSSSPGPFTFAANSDTYRDLHSDGTFTYTSVANGRPAPAVAYTGPTSSTIRVAVTVTDGVGVIYDAMLASILENWQAVDVVPGAGVGVASIAITPTSGTISSGHTLKFTATATYADGHTADISSVVAWGSSDLSKATLDFTGNASWVASGASTISCSLDGLAGSNTAALTTS